MREKKYKIFNPNKILIPILSVLNIINNRKINVINGKNIKNFCLNLFFLRI